ncbi:MAG: RNA-directed DNA polymerase [Deltaproteobacteria bacterium]|nr:RNA-directed DNA polymerase [Deltaproteobacteria bacterium]
MSAAQGPGWEVGAERLRCLARLAARGKRRSAAVARFMLDLDRHVHDLAADLAAGTYRPAAGRAFWIRDPKPRLICALPFRDRVAQHLLIEATLPAIERSLRPQTYACRRGFGTHAGLRRAADLARTHAFVLRVDVRRFFPSRDHAVRRRLLDHTTPPPWRWLRDRFLDAPAQVERVVQHFPGDDLLTPLARPHGLPIGSLTSQIWANVYLAPIDHLLAAHLGLGTFVRYCDDLLVFHDDPGRLRAALAAIRDRALELRLRLHPTKTRRHRTSDPVPFLGFVLRRRGQGVQVRLRHENVRRMRGRMRVVRALFACGALDVEEVTSRVRAWLAHARHGHTRALLEAELARLTFTRGDESPEARS